MSKKPSAFSLLELLIVIAILALLAVLAVPTLSSALQGIKITQGTQLLLDQITLARQLATSKNRAIETRFYSFTEPSTPGGKKAYQAFQNFELLDDGTAKPLGKIVRLPSGTILDSGGQLSSILGSARTKQWTATDTKISLPQINTAYDACAVVFRPDGCTDLNASGPFWFITLHAENDGDNLTSLPKNFSLVQIDPWTGSTSLFRP